MPPPKCVIPFYIARSGTDFDAWGTATLFEYQNRPFLLTAAHVIDGYNGNDQLLMPGSEGHMIDTPDHWQITKVPSGGTRKSDDKMDLAIALLPDAAAVDFIELGFQFLGESTIDPRPISRLDHLVILGFPGNHQTCLHFAEGSFVHARPAAFHTRPESIAAASELGFSSDHHIVAECKLANPTMPPNRRIDDPLPPGMSGGAVLRYEDGEPTGFIGITHRWYPEPGFLVATRSYAVFQMLDSALSSI